jgi:hypothetical protein
MLLTGSLSVNSVVVAADLYLRTRGQAFASLALDADNGWTEFCKPDIGAVIVTASARSLSNPSGARRIEAEAESPCG